MTIRQHFETRTRDDGTTFVTLTDDAPEWLRDAVMTAHDDEMPNDWRYSILERIAYDLDDADMSDEDEDHDTAHYIADSLTDIYTANLTAWLAGNLNRVSACDEAWREYGTDDADDTGIVRRITLGQYHTIYGMVATIIRALRDAEEES